MDTYIYLLITMAFSAFFSGMEIAFVSVDKLRFEMERKEGLNDECFVKIFKSDPSDFRKIWSLLSAGLDIIRQPYDFFQQGHIRPSGRMVQNRV